MAHCERVPIHFLPIEFLFSRSSRLYRIRLNEAEALRVAGISVYDDVARFYQANLAEKVAQFLCCGFVRKITNKQFGRHNNYPLLGSVTVRLKASPHGILNLFLVRVTNNPKLNRVIYSIELVSQLLKHWKLILVKLPQLLPDSGRKGTLDFHPPELFIRLVFHSSFPETAPSYTSPGEVSV
jgi:hypothetical protein